MPFLILLLFSSNVFSFSTDKNTFLTTTITWKAVDNVQEACNNEAVKRNFPKYSYKIDACSFWVDDNCLIITAKTLNHDTIGHEVRHCFSGNWHK